MFCINDNVLLNHRMGENDGNNFTLEIPNLVKGDYNRSADEVKREELSGGISPLSPQPACAPDAMITIAMV